MIDAFIVHTNSILSKSVLMVGVTILSTLDFRLDAPLSMSSTISGLDMEEEGSEDGAIEETGGAEEDSNVYPTDFRRT